MKRLLALFLLALLAVLIFPGGTNAVSQYGAESLKIREQVIKEIRERQILVMYKENASSQAKLRVAGMPEISNRAEMLPNVDILTVKDDVNIKRVLSELQKEDSVVAAEMSQVSRFMDGEPTTFAEPGCELERQYMDLRAAQENNEDPEEYAKGHGVAIEDLGHATDMIRESLNSSHGGDYDIIYEMEPNNSINTATYIELDYYVGGTITDVYYDLDYYALPITDTGFLNILGVCDYPQYLAIALLDSSGNHLVWGSLTSKAQYLQAYVKPGLYYVLVFQCSDYKYLLNNMPYMFTTWMSGKGLYIPVSSVALNRTNLCLYEGESETLQVTVYPGDASDKSVLWSSSDNAIATVDQNGKVVARNQGETTIRVKTCDGGLSATCNVEVLRLPTNNSPVRLSDPFYGQQFWLDMVNAPRIWGETKGGKQAVVAVIDGGLDLLHEDFAKRVAPGGYNFIIDNFDVYDIGGHGTAVSGVIAAEADNGRGIAGVAGPLDVRILPLQVAFFDGTSYTSDIVRAIGYAINRNVDVINLSLGSYQYSAILNAAIQDAISKNIAVVASAGNDGESRYVYPASYNGVISVGALSPSGQIAYFSNRNDKVDFTAPGEYVFTTKPYDGYDYKSGTSFSAPIVAGIAAIIKSVRPSITPGNIVRILGASAIDKGAPGKDNTYGYGLVNAYDGIIGLISPPPKDYLQLPAKMNVAVNKGWKIEFNLRLDAGSISPSQIYITDTKGTVLPSNLGLSDDGKKVFITPKQPYSCGKVYSLYIEDGIKALSGDKLKRPVKMEFSFQALDQMQEENELYGVLPIR